jgi:hypothetical protein
MKAAIQNGIVVDIHSEGYECHPSITWVDCSDEVKHGWTYDGLSFTTNEPQFTAEEELDRLRAKRNAKLAETDWVVTMHKELGTNIPAAWKTYRQALRDITDTYTSMDDVVWPEKPE